MLAKNITMPQKTLEDLYGNYILLGKTGDMRMQSKEQHEESLSSGCCSATKELLNKLRFQIKNCEEHGHSDIYLDLQSAKELFEELELGYKEIDFSHAVIDCMSNDLAKYSKIFDKEEIKNRYCYFVGNPSEQQKKYDINN